MSRKIILRWAAGASVFLLCAAVRISWSDDFNADDNIRPVANQPDVKAVVPDPNAAELRRRIVELTAKQAQRMNNDELTRAIAELTKTLADQDTAAEAELQKAIDQLKSVVAKFPGTPAAERSSRALEAISKPGNIAPKKGPVLRPALNDDDGLSFLSDEEDSPPPVKKTPSPSVSKRTR